MRTVRVTGGFLRSPDISRGRALYRTTCWGCQAKTPTAGRRRSDAPPAPTLHFARGVDTEVAIEHDVVSMIARCARHQHPELFGGAEVPAEELPSLGYEAIPPGFNSEGVVPEDGLAA